MKAPDKIYVAESLIKTPYGNEWSPTPCISRENTEYIRKDALLEWAKEKQEQMKIEAGGCSNMLAAGKYLGYKETIDKIESL